MTRYVVMAGDRWVTAIYSAEVSRKMYNVLDQFAFCLEKSGQYTTNDKLKVFDQTFNDAGWDGQGFRWKHQEIVYGELP